MPSLTAPVGIGGTPEFGTDNGPDHPGKSFVFRSNDGIFLSSVDELKGLVVRHYNTENIDFCGGTDVAPTAEAQIVFTPGAAIYTWRTGELPVYVYRISEVPPGDPSPDFCQKLKDLWIYRGTHRLTNHDNNLFFELGRTNAFGWNGEGRVHDRLGRTYAYRESFLAASTPLPDPDPTDDVVPQIERTLRYVLSIK